MRSPWLLLRDRAGERARRWALHRQGADPAQLTLASRRIYVLPTASGLVYGVMLVTMLAGSMNYNNNLGFALTFLLAAIGIVTIHHTHRTLAGLRLLYLGAEPVFAGDPLEVRVGLANDSRSARDEIFIGWPGHAEVPGGMAPTASRTVTLPLPTSRRGALVLPALRLATRAPLGLVQAWAWVHLQPRPIVYPRPAPRVRAMSAPDAHPEAQDAGRSGGDDFAGLRDYHAGDSPRRIAWKSYARTGDLLVSEYRGESAETVLWIDWDALPASDVETRIARLARLVLDAFESARPWGLRVPGTRIEPGQGREQLHACLRCLALAGPPQARP